MSVEKKGGQASKREKAGRNMEGGQELLWSYHVCCFIIIFAPAE